MAVSHDLPLISTVAVGLSLAFLCGLVASKLRLPPIVGYLVAGIIVGPYTPGFTADIATAEQLSEIGVVLLLFGVGLHFSIQDFMQVRRIASVGAILLMGSVTALGAGLAVLWDWPISSGVIFGLSLSVASTVVLLRTLEEHHLLNSMSGKIAIGWLIMEDIAMVLALVMIPAVALGSVVDDSGQGADLVMKLLTAIGKVILFAIVMFVAGRRILPWLLTAVSRTGSRELFTLAVFSMAMGIAFGAAVLFDVSFALGAFFAGMMIRESDLNHEVADRALPFQDAFAVLFFVAVGMLFDPHILVEHPFKVLITVFIIVFAKSFLTYLITRALRYPKKTSIMVAASLAQIGEFSFILIALGASVGFLNDEARNLILSGALLSVALNPMIFKLCHKYTLSLAPSNETEDELAHLEQEECTALKDLVILIGYGDVGEKVADTLNAEHIDLVIVDQNRELIESLRAKGFHAIVGEASNAETLEEALISKARAVIVTVPNPFEARQIVEAVHVVKPEVKIIIRAHNHEESIFFEAQNIDLAVLGTDEIARRIVQGVEQLRATGKISLT